MPTPARSIFSFTLVPVATAMGNCYRKQIAQGSNKVKPPGRF